MGRFAYRRCSTGAPEGSAIIKVNYLIHCLEWKQVNIAILHRKLGYLLNLDLCCVARECLLFLSYIWLVRDLTRLKHFFKCALDTSVLGTFVLTVPLYIPCMLSRVGSLYELLYTCLLAYYAGCCNLDNKQQTIKKIQTYNFCSLYRLENIPNGSCSIWLLYRYLQK